MSTNTHKGNFKRVDRESLGEYFVSIAFGKCLVYKSAPLGVFNYLYTSTSSIDNKDLFNTTSDSKCGRSTTKRLHWKGF